MYARLNVTPEEASSINMSQEPISQFKNHVSFRLHLKDGDIIVECYTYHTSGRVLKGDPFNPY
jgi:hypothetical protein